MQSDPVPDKLVLDGIPPHIESWSVAGIPGFVVAVLKRWQRHYGELPTNFRIVMCPQVEVYARGGLPSRVYELTDPRLRCQHFTGCHKPYFVLIFTGPDAEQSRAEAQQLLAWSEGYQVDITADTIRLTFAGAVEDVDDIETGDRQGRRLQELIENGELVSILA